MHSSLATVSDLVSQLDHPIDVEFTGIEVLESYPECGMRATIVSAREIQDGVVVVRVSYAKYDSYNEAFETPNYWGRELRGQDPDASMYSARETGWYTEEEDLYLMGDCDIASVMIILDTPTRANDDKSNKW